MNRNAAFCILLCTLIAYSVQAQNIPPALDSMLRHTLDSAQTAMKIKSLSAAIQLSDTVVWAAAKGISSEAEEVTPEHVYLYGSVAKTLTAACILQLAQEGKLSIDDSLYKWLDTMEYINPTITIKQLLRHQSGIFDVLGNPDCMPALYANPKTVVTAEELIVSFIMPPDFAPGTKWAYSNTNYFLLAMIIEKITGNVFYKELRNRFFTPLGLKSVAIPAFESLTKPVAHVWIDLTNDNVTDDAHGFYFNNVALNSAAGAAGGFYGTAYDASKWMRTYMRGDLLTPSIMARAKETVPATGLPAVNYGLGLMKKSFAGYEGWGHGGDLGYAASSWYFPAKDISISVLTNDSKFISWTLAPVVAALLKTYNDWGSTVSSISAEEHIGFEMSAFPNPFENNIQLAVNMPNAADEIQIDITNVLGNTVRSITRQNLPSGYTVLDGIDANGMVPGVYFLSVSMNGNTVRTMTLLKQTGK